jgi:hypothetical protein
MAPGTKPEWILKIHILRNESSSLISFYLSLISYVFFIASFNSTFINSKSTTFNQSHKRTNSHSLNSTSFNNNISRPSLTNLHGSNSDLHKIPSQSSLSATTAVRSQHHHHHSISTHPTLLHTSNSTAALIDLSGNGSKSPDLKII